MIRNCYVKIKNAIAVKIEAVAGLVVFHITTQVLVDDVIPR